MSKADESQVSVAMAFARYEMFREAADHLDQDITEDEEEIRQIPYVQRLLRRNADKWLTIAHKIEDGGTQ